MSALRNVEVALVAAALPVLLLSGSTSSAPSTPTIAAIAAGGGSDGEGHTCALTAAGGVLCWGQNSFGQLGDGTTDNRTMPVSVTGLERGVIAVQVGGYHTCALTSVGGVKCWGINVRGQLGIGAAAEESRLPVDVLGLASGVSAISASVGHTCALTTVGGVKCWGMNLALGPREGASNDDVFAPLGVPGLKSGITAIAAGTSHTCALSSAGGVKCWGNGMWGQLGDGVTAGNTVPISHQPVDVVGLTSGVVAIAAGDAHTCALTAAGAVKCWGANLANGTDDNSDVPVDVTGLASGITAIAANYWHTCALTPEGRVKCWGANDHGELGDGTTIGSRIPVDVTVVGSGNIAVALGGYHTCALTSAGGVKCWGANGYGQLGDGSMTDSLVPVTVVLPATPPPLEVPATATSPEGGTGTSEAPLIPLLAGITALLAILIGRRRGRREGGE